MRTTSASYSRIDSIPRGSSKEDFGRNKAPVSVSSGPSEYGGTQTQSRSDTRNEIRPHSVALDSDMNARHMKVDILSIKDEVASISAAPVLRVKSGNRLARNFSEGSHEEKLPLMREQPKARRALTEEAGFVPPRRQHSFREDVGHAAKETFLLTRLAFNLLRYLG